MAGFKNWQRKKTGKRKKPKKKFTVSWWKEKAWKQFSEFVRLRDALLTTGEPLHLHCVSCGKRYPAFGKPCAQAGHLIPSRSHILLFDERSVNGQCYNCNQTLNGNWVGYEKWMLRKWGQEITDRCKQMYYEKTFKYLEYELEEIRDYYKALIKTMRRFIAADRIEACIEMLNDRKLDKNGRPLDAQENKDEDKTLFAP